ncbi:MAG TPA: class I SAM-dependent methyltransferase, partial [Gallionellaceae bacterium]|nr:class I SAM-dependent methyltransferase [Gallionellaceae bacterium]
MDHKQAEPACNSINDELNYLAPAGKQQSILGNISFSVEKFLLSKILRVFGDPPLQVELWNGDVISNHEGNAAARILIRDRRALLKLLADPELNFGELYSTQRIEVQGNLLEFLEAVYRAWPTSSENKIEMLLAPLFGTRRNSFTRARSNIHHHYDIGNDFYKLWLDERMLYTCAYFHSHEASLEEAQLAKLDHVCRKLCLK